jgi:hypothetical protein
MAHLHNGKQGEIGPPVIPLYKSDYPTILINGKLAGGNITVNILEGSMKGKTNLGPIYSNVKRKCICKCTYREIF